MPTIPIRGLASQGILKDPSPYDLAATAWSGGSNVRFDGTKAMRAPIWRSLVESLTFTPAHIVGYRPSTGYDTVFMAGSDGQLYRWAAGTVSNLTYSGFSGSALDAQFTSSFLGDVAYINRLDHVPAAFVPGATAFEALPNWDSTWRAGSLRVYGDTLVAMNVTKGSQTNGTMVKTSDLTLAGQVPDSWDATDPTKNTTENVLAELTSPIVDGCPMRGIFVIYSSDQIWGMTAVSTQDVFEYARLFSEGGLIGLNCVTEVNGVHYCFGPFDIYRHDGTTKESISDKRVRKYIYRNLNVRLAHRCFTQYIPSLNEVHFFYVSGDTDAYFTSPSGCNKVAVYNISGNTWSFGDAPNLASATLANVNSTLTWNTASALTWANVGGTWYDQTDNYDEHCVGVSQTLPSLLSSNRLICYDFMDTGSVAAAYSPECNPPAFLERTGIDLDELQAGIATYKKINRVFPQIAASAGAFMTVSVGGALTAGGVITWSPPVLFDPVNDYKVDAIIGGRYLAYHFSVSTPADFEATGLDVSVINGGAR